jgi:ATP-dependent helicase YprA (DUF1998 family)
LFKIIQLLDEDPECQVVIATIAFANGLNVKSLLDSISHSFPDTVDQLWKEKGQVGRNPEMAAWGVVLFQPSSLASAGKQMSGEFFFLRLIYEVNFTSVTRFFHHQFDSR